MRAAELHRLARTVREIALMATGNTGEDRVNAGELAVLEDIATHPCSTIGEITRRTGLAQSLVSRITRRMVDAGALVVRPDSHDRRKVRIELRPTTHALIIERAGNSISAAVAARTPALSKSQRRALEHHLSEAARLLRIGAPGESVRKSNHSPRPAR
jgi:DNA-binding MarR family transcriptional regulator